MDPAALGDHIDRLYRAAWSMCGNREEAEDLVQETFVRVLARPRILKSDDDIGYLLRVLRNTLISSRRARGSRPQEAAMPEGFEPEDRLARTPERHLAAQELYAAVSSLPEDFRDAVIAVDVMGLSYREAGRALKVREATITTRVHGGRKRLTELLDAPE